MAGTIRGVKDTTVFWAKSKKLRIQSIAVDCTSSSGKLSGHLEPFRTAGLAWIRQMLNDNVHDGRVIDDDPLSRDPSPRSFSFPLFALFVVCLVVCLNRCFAFISRRLFLLLGHFWSVAALCAAPFTLRLRRLHVRNAFDLTQKLSESILGGYTHVHVWVCQIFATQIS